MTEAEPSPHAVVDVIFPVIGSELWRDHAQSLQQALSERLPWLNDDKVAGIHSIKLAPGTSDTGWLSRRSCLLLRVAAQRADEIMALSGTVLTLAGYPLRLGTAHLRQLLPHGTVYAYKVHAQNADELAFMAAVAAELASLGIKAEPVCGKRQHMQMAGSTADLFSLMLHRLSPEHSLRLQQHGLGRHRQLGCGIFVPHKSAAAV